MAPSKTLTTKVQSGTPYQLDLSQVLKASTALTKHISSSSKALEASTPKRNLLADADDEEPGESNETPIWLVLTTKKHIVDKQRLKPSKIVLKHALNTNPSTTICLITGDKQRTYKDIVASAAFPSELAARITRVIDLGKLKTKYKQYEKQRQLLSEHDIFLADDRIITELPKVLGKTFYKSSAKRPCPVDMQAPKQRVDGKSVKRAQGDIKSTIEPAKLAAQIEKSISCALVALAPSTTTSVRIGYAGWEASKIADNIEVVTNEMVEKFVPQKWRGVKSLHIKAPESVALPIWLADELWADEKDVLEDSVAEQLKAEEEQRRVGGRKRKAGGVSSDTAGVIEAPLSEQSKKAKLTESNDANLDAEIALRKEKLKKQKEEAAKSVDVGAETEVKQDAKKAKKEKRKSAGKA